MNNMCGKEFVRVITIYLQGDRKIYLKKTF